MVNRAEIGRFDGVLSPVVFSDGQTINDLLNKASLTLSSGESVNNNNAESVNLTDLAQDGEVYQIAGNFKQG